MNKEKQKPDNAAVLATKPTMTTLSVSPNPSTRGQKVVLVITVREVI